MYLNWYMWHWTDLETLMSIHFTLSFSIKEILRAARFFLEQIPTQLTLVSAWWNLWFLSLSSSQSCCYGYLHGPQLLHVFGNIEQPQHHLPNCHISDCIRTVSSVYAERINLINFIVNLHHALKFTWTIFATSLPFLDLSASISADNLSTDIYCKLTDFHSYLKTIPTPSVAKAPLLSCSFCTSATSALEKWFSNLGHQRCPLSSTIL